MTDLTKGELLGIADRLDRAFQRRSLLPLQSLQYRLGEAGQNRVHPYALRRALRALARPVRSKSTAPQPLQPWTLEPWLYASPSLSASEAVALAEEHRPDLQRLAMVDWHQSFEQFIAAITQSAGPVDDLRVPGIEPVEAPLAADLRVPGYSRVLRHQGAGPSNVHLWITQQAHWIHPDDPRLWTFLASCLRDEAVPLVIARAIDPATFPLFKALRVHGLQYYGMWSTAEVREFVTNLPDRLGWFYLNPVEQAAQHRLFEQLPKALLSQSSSVRAAPVREALEQSVALGLGEAGPDKTERLLTWARESKVALPDAWQETLQRWIAWSQGGALRLPRESGRRATAVQRPGGGSHDVRPNPTAQEGTTEAAPPKEKETRGFGRETQVSRVAIRLR